MGAVWFRAMVYAEPPCAFRFIHFHAKAWNVEGARYFFSCGGIFGFGRAGGFKNRGVKDRLIALRQKSWMSYVTMDSSVVS